MRPLKEPGPEFSRYAQKLGNGDNRDGRRETFEEIRFAPPCKAVDQFMRKSRDARSQPLNCTRQEGAVNEPAQSRMDWRLRLEQRVALYVIKGLEMKRRFRPAEFLARHHMQDLATEAPVTEKC